MGQCRPATPRQRACYIGIAMEHALPIPPPGFDDLEVDQQIEYVQALWDRIAAKESAIPVPEWHREILDERLADLEADPEESALGYSEGRFAQTRVRQEMIPVVVRRRAEADL